MIQDPEYVKKVHKALTDKVDGFNKSLEEFSASLNDDKYVSNVYKALSDKVDGFSKTPEQFKSLVSSPKPQKKNSNSTGTTPQKVSATKPKQKTTTSVGEKPVKTTPSGSSFGGSNNMYGGLNVLPPAPQPSSKKPKTLNEALGTPKTIEESIGQAKFDFGSKIKVPILSQNELVNNLQKNRAKAKEEGLDSVVNESSTDFEDAVSGSGILNKAENFIRGSWNTAIAAASKLPLIGEEIASASNKMGIIADKNSVEKYFKQADDLFNKQGVKASEQDRYNKAKELKIEEDKRNYIENQDSKFLESIKNDEYLDPNTGVKTKVKDLLSLNDYNKYKTLDKETVDLSNKVKLNDLELQSIYKEIQQTKDVLNHQIIFGNFQGATDIYNKLKSKDGLTKDESSFVNYYEKNKEQAAKSPINPNLNETVAKLNQSLSDNSSKYNESLKQYYTSLEKYENKYDDKVDVYEDFDNSKRSYDNVFLDKGIISAKETVNGVVKMVETLADLSSEIKTKYNLPAPGLDKYLFNKVFEGYNYYDFKNQIDKEKELIREDVKEVTDANSLINYFSDVSSTQLGQMALPMMAGYGKIAMPLLRQSAVYFSSGFGRGVGESENYEERLSRGEVEPGEIGKVYSTWEKVLHGSLSGTADIIGNLPTAIRFSKGLNNVLQTPSTSSMFWKSFAKKGLEYGKETGIDLGKELGEETLAEWMQNASKVFVLQDPTAKLGDGTIDVLKDTTTFTGLMKVFPLFGKGIVNRISNSNESKFIQEKEKELGYWKNRVNEEGISEDTKKLYNDKALKIESELNSTYEKARKRIAEKPFLLKEVEDVNSQIEEKIKEGYSIKDNNELTDSEKTILLKEKELEYSKLNEKRDNILSDKYDPLSYLPEEESTKLKVQAAEELKAEAIKSGIEEGKVNIKEEEITKRAIDNYEKQSKETTVEKPTKEGPTGQENVQDVAATQGQQNQVVQEEKNSVDELRGQEIAELKEQVENSEEFITDGKVDANKIYASDNAKAKEIYAKYDKLLKPLLTNIKTKEDAIQEQSTSEGVLRPEQSEMGFQEVVQRDQEPEVATEEVKSEEKVVENIFDLDKDAKLEDKGILDKAIEFLDKAEKDLQDIQKSGLKGVLIPAPAVQVAIKAMKGALKTVKTIGELIEVGINALKETEWYKNLTPEVQSNIESELPSSLSEYVLKNQQKKAERDEVKAESSKLNKERKAAIKNVKSGKTGFLNNQSPTFRFVSLNPKIVKLSLSPEMFEKYKSYINVLSKRRLSLNLSELGGIEEFSNFYKEVEKKYMDTSDKILSIQNEIDNFEEANPNAKRDSFKPSENDKEFYNENKTLFNFNNVDSETTDEVDEELDNSKEEIINNIPAIKGIATDSEYSPTSKSFQILSLFADLKQSDLDMLNRNQIIGLNNAINAIVDGFEIPTYANDIFTAVMANRNKYGLSKNVEDSYKKTGLASNRIFKAIDSLFSRFRQDEKTKAYKTNLTSIDAAFKIYGGIPKVADIVAENFKGIPVLRYIMGAIQKQQGRVNARVEEVMSNLDKVRGKLIEKSKDYEESLMKIHFAFLSAQKNSNPDNNTVQTAKDSFLANSKSSSYTKSERKKYAEFINKYGDYSITYDNGVLKVTDGNGNEVSDFFSKEELDSYNAIRKELDIQAEAAYESQFYHEKNASPLITNYFPQNNYSKVYGNEELDTLQKAFNNPSLRSSNVKSRVSKQQAHAVGHNPFSIAVSAIKSVELQHKLLTDVNIAKRALTDLIKENEGNEDLKFLYENILGVVNKFVEQTQNATRIDADSIGNDISRVLENIFFRSTLASVDRTIKDLTANYTGLLLSDGEKLLSSKLVDDLNSVPKEKRNELIKNFLINSGASQPTRLMNNDFDVKTSRIDFQTEGASSLLTNRGFSNKFKTFIDSATRKSKLNVPGDFAKRMNEQLQSFSDNAPALSLWAGSFYKEFEALSGTSVDMQKIASGDKAYLLKYKKEIEIASLIANYTLSSRLGSKNIAEGVQKIIDLSKNQGGNNVFEKYMNYLFSRFRIISARDTRTAINNLIENGFGDERGAQERIIVGNALRNVVYTALAGVIPLKFASLLIGGDDDEEKIKDNLDDMSSDPEFMKGIVEIYNKYEEQAKKLEDSDEYMQNILEMYRDRRSELMNLLKDDRFREAVEARYRFFAREHFNKIINGHSANVDAMKKLDGNMSYINNVIKMIDDKDEPVNYTKYVDLLSYINSEYGYTRYNAEERKDILDKAISRMEEDGFYTFKERNGGLNKKGEYDITTSEGKFKVANLFQTIDMLKNHRYNSIEGRALRGALEFGINTAAGSRGNIKVRAISTLVEVLNKYQREERYGFYDSSKDRITNGFGRTMLNGETAFDGKFKVEEDDITGKSLGLSKEIGDVINMTVPELAMISKMTSEPKYADIGMLLGLPTSTDLSKILREVEKDEVYQNARGKVFYDASEKNKVFNKKDTLYKFPIKMDVESSKVIKK